MRPALVVLVSAVLSSPVFADNVTQTYWLLKRADWHTWCGYTSLNEFKVETEKLKPTDTIKVTYSSNRLIDLTYQVNSESGDWIVIDNYTPLNKGLLLKRVNLLAQPEIEIVQETTIHRERAQPFRVISVTSLGKKKGKASVDLSKVDYPLVKIMTNPSVMPFMDVISEMRKQELQTLCKPR